MNYKKYTPQIFNPSDNQSDKKCEWVKKTHIKTAPIWCSVDLRDGNQALAVPMTLQEKIEFFNLLVKIGFKEIEVGFPAASQTEFKFVRTLIENELIPDDVTIQVLTQSRAEIIEKTFGAIKGTKRAIVHFYNSVSKAQREQVFKKSREEIIEIAECGASICKNLSIGTDFEKADIRFEYSPESFTGTEPEFAAEICNRVANILKPSPQRKLILNLPVTVELAMPHIYANQVEYFCANVKNRENIIVSLHPHNDRGTAVADAEFGLLAGAQRVEGTLFGNGERTGNVDLLTLAVNMFSQGVDPELDLNNVIDIKENYERLTGMRVYERQPYAGELVFAAFSGSHQDAIDKALKYAEENAPEFWTVPYLPIDPLDIGRGRNENIIRINSQSGKGGVGHVLEAAGYTLPAKMREDFSKRVKQISDEDKREITAENLVEIFKDFYVNLETPLKLVMADYARNSDKTVDVTVEIEYKGKKYFSATSDNGPLAAFYGAVKAVIDTDFDIFDYSEHALTGGANSKACSYVGIRNKGSRTIYWGVGIDEDITISSNLALISALNLQLEHNHTNPNI